MLNYRLKIGDKIFPNRLISFAERRTRYTQSGTKINDLPLLTIQLSDYEGVSNLDIVAAIDKNPVFTVIDQNNNNKEIATFSNYTVFGSCDRTLEEDGFKILLSMFTDKVEEIYQQNIASGVTSEAPHF